jgi:hypothetical protein
MDAHESLHGMNSCLLAIEQRCVLIVGFALLSLSTTRHRHYGKFVSVPALRHKACILPDSAGFSSLYLSLSTLQLSTKRPYYGTEIEGYRT